MEMEMSYSEEMLAKFEADTRDRRAALLKSA
jgi:hypothetical protein